MFNDIDDADQHEDGIESLGLITEEWQVMHVVESIAPRVHCQLVSGLEWAEID